MEKFISQLLPLRMFYSACLFFLLSLNNETILLKALKEQLRGVEGEKFNKFYISSFIELLFDLSFSFRGSGWCFELS